MARGVYPLGKCGLVGVGTLGEAQPRGKMPPFYNRQRKWTLRKEVWK